MFDSASLICSLTESGAFVEVVRGLVELIYIKHAKTRPRTIAIKGLLFMKFIIPAHNIPSFKPAKVFADGVKSKVEVK
jgi:hypothetical protein